MPVSPHLTRAIEKGRNKNKSYETLPPRRISLYANKPLHAMSVRANAIQRLEFTDRNAAPSLVTRSSIAIERTSRNTPPSLHRRDKRTTERGQNQERHDTS